MQVSVDTLMYRHYQQTLFHRVEWPIYNLEPTWIPIDAIAVNSLNYTNLNLIILNKYKTEDEVYKYSGTGQEMKCTSIVELDRRWSVQV